MIPRLFIDSSVLFAASYSTRGHSHDLVLMGTRREIKFVLSGYVLEEARRNLASLKQPKDVKLEQIVANVAIEIVEVSRDEVQQAERLVVPKDAPIIAAAKAARVDMLVSLDKKHILGRPELADYIGAAILSPKEAIEHIRGYDKL